MLRQSLATLKYVAVIILASAATSAAKAQTAPPPAPVQAQTQAPTSAPAQTPPKKVWTNDDLSASSSQPDGAPPASSGGPNSKTNPTAKSKNKKDAKWYQDQIAKFQSQIPPLDKSIAELQAALDGQPVNETRHYPGSRIGDWKDQLAQLEKKRQDTLDRISVLEDEARHNGVAPSALP
jgi:hypothetical protein